MATAFIARPGMSYGRNFAPPDLWASDFADLAGKLAAR
jgi:hypothetical protein